LFKIHVYNLSAGVDADSDATFSQGISLQL